MSEARPGSGLVDRVFGLRKLYADLVTEDGHVVIVYVMWLSVSGVWISYAAVEMYRPDGSRQVLHGRQPKGGPLRTSDGGLEYRVEVSDGRVFRLVHHGPLRQAQSKRHIGDHAAWEAVVARAPATASWGGDWSLTGTGYADWLDVNRPPRQLGVSRLQWGRIHLPQRTIVFNDVGFHNGDGWRQVVEWEDDSPVVQPVGPRPDGDGVRVPTSEGTVRLNPERVLHEGTALDPDRVPNPVTRWGGYLLSGPSYETRWLSRAVPDEGDTGLAIHESVHFGASEVGP